MTNIPHDPNWEEIHREADSGNFVVGLAAIAGALLLIAVGIILLAAI